MANIELDGTNKKIKVDSGDLTLDVPGDIILDADGADLVFADGGTNILKITNSSSDVVLQPQVDAKDIIFKQYDGRALLDINDGGFVGIYNGATGPGQLRLYEDTDNGTNYTALQVGTQSGDITYTLPTADGSNGHALTTNGSGTLSWASAGTTYAGIDDQSSSNDDQITISDTAVIINEDSDDVDFRVESNGNANMLVVDASTDCVAIGQAAGSGSYELDVAGNVRLYSSADSFRAIDFDANRGSNGDFLADLTANWNGTEVCRFSFRAGDDTTNKDNGFFAFENATAGSLSEVARIPSGGGMLVNTTTDDGNSLTGGGDFGAIVNCRSTKTPGFAFQSDGMVINRSDADNNNRDVIMFYRNGSNAGNISASNSTVSYGTFLGVHYAQLTDDSKPDILVGTVMESINETSEWHMAQFTVPEHKDDNGETVPETVKKRYIPKTNNVGDNIKFKWHKNYKEGDAGFDANAVEYDAVVIKENDEEYLARAKVSDTENSKAVYGVFESWMESEANDMQVASLGAFMIRVHKDETVTIGDYLQSKGDGTAKVQADDILRGSTIAKVVKTNKIKTYADGSYLVSCTLHCG